MQVKKKGKSLMKKNYHKLLYPSKVDGSIPGFKNYEEEANFWDTHNVTDFENETEEVDIVFELDKPREESLVLRLQKGIKKALSKTARSKGLNISTLVRMWIMEKLQEDLAGKKKLALG